MHYVSLIIEFLRGRPAVVFWTVALTQAALWTLMPALFYSAPPGDVPLAARHRPRIRARQLSRAAAGVLARRDRLPPRRRVRALRAGASLHRRHLLGGVHARPPHRRHPPCGARRAADGRHRRLHGAEPGFRPGDPGGAAVGAGAAALLARGRRRRARLLVPARARSRPAAARKLCRADPARAVARVHACEPRAGARRCSIRSRGSRCCRSSSWCSRIWRG